MATSTLVDPALPWLVGLWLAGVVALSCVHLGGWVRVRTDTGEITVRARFNAYLDPQVVVGQHGWWQACSTLDAPGYPAVGPGTANYNLLIGHDAVDPVSGSVPLNRVHG